eukprot:TRINITY_DN16_c0_g1_i1.p1 TRINITY_DN16_c0_g1~~TRINITY_DN16_c0_g1_i1.p1  ORF type:complete len:198 (+),score=10.58 TRINITY_DN16_c0_g1_i1:186-779(+)
MSCRVVSGGELPLSLHTKSHLYPTKKTDFAVRSLKNARPRGKTTRVCASFTARPAVDEWSSVATSAQQSFYELLGISESVGMSEIKQAYKQMARKYHPDVSPPDQTKEYTMRFIQVQEAYETLSDPMTRAVYDRNLARGLHFAFSARKRYDEGMEERGEWKIRWQDQMAELKRRSMNKDSEDNMSWGARMRMQRNRS